MGEWRTVMKSLHGLATTQLCVISAIHQQASFPWLVSHPCSPSTLEPRSWNILGLRRPGRLLRHTSFICHSGDLSASVEPQSPEPGRPKEAKTSLVWEPCFTAFSEMTPGI